MWKGPPTVMFETLVQAILSYQAQDTSNCSNTVVIGEENTQSVLGGIRDNELVLVTNLPTFYTRNQSELYFIISYNYISVS